MATKLLADSCAYFRLARYVRPLLGRQLGDPPYVIHVIPELDEEFGKSSKLQNQFHWVSEPEYLDNRTLHYLGQDLDKFDVTEAIRHLTYHKHARGLGVSKVDIKVIAVAHLLEIPIISDDADVRVMVGDFDTVDCMSSVEVLQWLYGEGVLTMQQVKAAVSAWKYDHDLPCGITQFESEFIELFEEAPW